MRKALLFLFALCGVANPVYSAATFRAATSASQDAGGGTTQTISFTVNAGDILILGAGVSTGGGGDVVAVTWNTTETWTQIDSIAQGGLTRTALWYLVPVTTGTHDVVITYVFDQDFAAGIVAITGGNLVTPIGTPANGQNSSGAASIDVTAATDDLVIDAVVWNANNNGAVGAGQTQRVDQLGGSSAIYLRMSTEPGATTTTMSWADAGVDYGQIGVAVKAAPAARRAGKPIFLD